MNSPLHRSLGIVSALRAAFSAAPFAGAALCAAAVNAQERLDAPPPLPAEVTPAEAAKAPAQAAPAKPASAKPAPTKPSTRIESPDADVENPLPPARVRAPETVIEQRRQGNRVVEIVVTPAGTTYSYVIKNREGMRPLSPQELSAGLSTPRFLRFDF